jgi:hypothetical protein
VAPNAPSQRRAKKIRRSTPIEGNPIIIKDDAPMRAEDAAPMSAFGGSALASAGRLGIELISN